MDRVFVPRIRAMLLVAVVLLAGVQAHALEVRETLWGFDGRVVPNRFVPLSVLVSNPGAQPFDGELTLINSQGFSARDIEIVQPIYLAPRTERWVQFATFYRRNCEFQLRWGRGAKEAVEINDPTVGAPARILLTDPANPFAAAGGLRAFPDDLFPTSIATLDGLDAVALDYVPRWEPARRDAFLDWLRSGGTVAVLRGSGGAYPEFTDALSVLNVPSDSAFVGAGRVIRSAATRREANDQLFAAAGLKAREIETSKQPIVHDLEQSLFARLASFTRPRIQWWIINTLTLCFVLLVGPLQYRWAKKRDYRLSIAIFLAAVALFSWIFSVVGRRGYGESQTVHSVTIARALGGGRCDAMQWVSAFATSGAIYELSHASPAGYYSAVPTTDSVRGRAYNGRDARLFVDIPLYSSRAFVHRGVMQGDDTSVTVEKWDTATSPIQLIVKLGANAPREVESVHVRYDSRIAEMVRSGDRWVMSGDGLRSPQSLLSPETLQPLVNQYADNSSEESADQRLRKLAPLMIARALGGTAAFVESIPERSLPPDRAQLFIYARAPEGFHMRGKGFGKENGYVLYVQDIQKPQPGSTPP